jgi:ABC-type lipoprotein release transport system permease subunit
VVVAVMVAASMLALLAPAWRAAQVPPVTVLRTD